MATVTTERFKEAVNKAVKGAGCNKLLPITEMIGIKLENNTLILSTTDKSNDLRVIIDKVQGENFDVTVQIDTFSKLIAKTTSDSIQLDVTEDFLLIKANGDYKIPLVMDEEGLVQFPDFKFDKNLVAPKEVLLSSIMSVFNANKSALATTLELPCITGYYLGEKAISTDANVICFNDVDVFGEPVLISAQMINLLTLNSQEKITIYKADSHLLFETDDIIIHGQELQGKEDYPVEEISAYLGESFPSMCKIPKSILSAVLGRLELFIEPYDKNGAYFTFTKDGIKIHSKKSASVEVVNYIESKDFNSFICCVDIPMMKQQLDSIPTDEVELYYGLDNALKLVSGKITQVISLLEDEDLEASNE